MALTAEQKRNISIIYGRSISYFCQGPIYDWSYELTGEDLHRDVKSMIKGLKSLNIDFTNLTVSDLEFLGCISMSEEQPNLYLIPLHLMQIIPEGIEVTNIFNEKIVIGPDFNRRQDIRQGLTPYALTAVD